MPIAIASAFAYPADLDAFRRAKSRGLTDRQAAAFGDNGIGLWGDDTTSEATPKCALPPEEWLAQWGTRAAARGRKVLVVYKGIAVVGELRDTLPSRAKIANGAGIDLNPGFAKAFGETPPFMLPAVEWNWI